jgi:multidrug resistance efflux pump
MAAEAGLAEAKATLRQREFDFTEVKDLREGEVASEQELAPATAGYESAKAAVQAADAAVRQAELDLSYMQIAAPRQPRRRNATPQPDLPISCRSTPARTRRYPRPTRCRRH